MKFVNQYKSSNPMLKARGIQPVGQQRWKVLSKCLSADIPKLCSILSLAQMRGWKGSPYVAIDEQILAWLANGVWRVCGVAWCSVL